MALFLVLVSTNLDILIQERSMPFFQSSTTFYNIESLWLNPYLGFVLWWRINDPVFD
jgi:hypothetical protein